MGYNNKMGCNGSREGKIGEILNLQKLEMKGGERNFARICDIGEVRNMGKVRSVMKIGISGKLGNKGNMRKMRTIRKIDKTG